MTLFPDFTALVIVGIVACLVPLLKRLLLEPVAQTMEARERERRSAEEAFGAAQVAERDAVRIGDETLAAARRAGYRDMETQRREAADRAGEALALARKKAAQTLEAGQARLQEQVREAEAALERTARSLGDELMARLLGRTG